MNMIENKLQFVANEVFLYDGDQIAFVSGPGIVCLCLSNEDLENGEIPYSNRKEIRANKAFIIEYIKKLGFSLEEEDEEEDDE